MKNIIYNILIIIILLLISGCAKELTCDNPQIIKTASIVEAKDYIESEVPKLCKSSYLINADESRDYEVFCELENTQKIEYNDIDSIRIICECQVCII